MKQQGSSIVIYAAIAANTAIAISKYVAAAFTGSSAMLSEAIHSTVDTGDQFLLLFGQHRAAKPPDPTHPFGYGLQLYFWAFDVAVMIFGLGAVISAYEGIDKVLHPHPIEDPIINYVVLGAALVFEGASWFVAFREFRRDQGEHSLIAAVRRSKDPTVFTVLFEDSAALIGLVLALVGVALAEVLNEPVWDGIASLGIAAVLAVTAFFLAYESQSLLTGEAAFPEVKLGIERIAAAAPEIVRTNEVMTMHFGPSDILVALSLDFDDRLSAAETEAAAARIERDIKAQYEEVSRVFVEPRHCEPPRGS